MAEPVGEIVRVEVALFRRRLQECFEVDLRGILDGRVDERIVEVDRANVLQLHHADAFLVGLERAT